MELEPDNIVVLMLQTHCQSNWNATVKHVEHLLRTKKNEEFDREKPNPQSWNVEMRA